MISFHSLEVEMSAEIGILSVTAVSIGFIHTVIGPDHYVPFIMLAKAGKWSMTKTVFITVLSGLGHVLSSVFIGLIGIALGTAVNKLEVFESVRGNIAGYMLIAFGLMYFIWGVRQSYKNKVHTHSHPHYDGEVHLHTHNNHDKHLHTHEEPDKSKINFWMIFSIFVFGPCEPLIPILMYPAAKASLWGMAIVTIVFGVVTISTMLTIVIVSIMGVNLLPVAKLERYMHALAGALILLSGLSIQLMGL
jgi:sulfite exporter TauE/SafE